ncbi:MAG TPA: phosphoadenosine phosphosulfate reductase family protein [Solirubrobacterales bacterium]|nr:phosphoadenosine phosphosulfate reductase family protein [Solirubrobacterales bacterium]
MAEVLDLSAGLTLIPRETPEQWIEQAKERWSPIRTFCLYSGGNDSGVLAHRCREHYDTLFYIDTGLAVPTIEFKGEKLLGVEDHVQRFAEFVGKPLVILRAGDAYRTMVVGDDLWWERFHGEPGDRTIEEFADLDRSRYDGQIEGRIRGTDIHLGRYPHGFPAAAQHDKPFKRLKERRIEEMRNIAKKGHSRFAKVLFLSGVRRDESSQRANIPAEDKDAKGSIRYVAPLVEWLNDEMRAYLAEHQLPQSFAAETLHRSGECNCGAASNDPEAERKELELWYPEWFFETIRPLELEAEAKGIRWCRWGGFDRDGNRASGEPTNRRTGAGNLCSRCLPGQMELG